MRWWVLISATAVTMGVLLASQHSARAGDAGSSTHPGSDPPASSAGDDSSSNNDSACDWCASLTEPMRLEAATASAELEQLSSLLHARVPVILHGAPEVAQSRDAWRLSLTQQRAERGGELHTAVAQSLPRGDDAEHGGWGHLAALTELYFGLSEQQREQAFMPFTGVASSLYESPPHGEGIAGAHGDSGSPSTYDAAVDDTALRGMASRSRAFPSALSFFEAASEGPSGELGVEAVMGSGEPGWYASFAVNLNSVATHLQRVLSPAPALLRALGGKETQRTHGHSWFYVGGMARNATLPLAATSRHRDSTGSWSSWHSQVRGRKGWALWPPSECAAKCNSLRFVVEESELFVFSADDWYHATWLPHQPLREDGEPTLSVDYNSKCLRMSSITMLFCLTLLQSTCRCRKPERSNARAPRLSVACLLLL